MVPVAVWVRDGDWLAVNTDLGADGDLQVGELSERPCQGQCGAGVGADSGHQRVFFSLSLPELWCFAVH